MTLTRLLHYMKIFPPSRPLGQRELALLAAGLVFAVYLRTMAPTVFPLDSAELVAGAVSLGLVHAPGYPVYLLLAHLFTYLPVGDIAYRVNLLSAVATVSTVALLVLLLRQMGLRARPAFVAGLSYGFSFYVWSLSMVAEVYTLQAFFLAVLLLALWHWQQHGSPRALLVVASMMGLAAANTPATILWWPGLLILAWMTPHRQQLSWRLALKLSGLFALALLPILYLPIRSMTHPAFNYVGHYDESAVFHPLDLTQLDNLLWYISGGPFSHLVWGYSGWELLTEGFHSLHRLWAAFLGIGLPLGLWGFWKLWQRHHVLALGLLLTVLPHAVFFTAYRVPDKETMFLPLFLIWAVFLSVGLEQLIEMLPRRLALVELLLPLGLLIINVSYADVSDLLSPHEIAEIRLQTTESNAIYMAIWDNAAVMEYIQITRGFRPDVTVINTFMTSPSVQQALVKNALRTKRPVYTTFIDPILVRQYDFIPVDHGFQLRSKGR